MKKEMMKRAKMKKEKDEKRKGLTNDNRGMGTVEMILIIVVLIGLVLIFKTQIQGLTTSIFDKIAADSSAILA